MNSISFHDIKVKVIRLIGESIVEPGSGDPQFVSGKTTDAAFLMDAVHAAMDAITIKRWRPSLLDTLTIIQDDAQLVYALPDDVLEIESVLDLEQRTFVPEVVMAVGQNGLFDGTSNSWMMYPNGYITFSTKLGIYGARIYYSGVWKKPQTDAELLETPANFTNAISFYAAHYCFLRKASSAANVRNFNTKVDSGTPDDNALKEMSDFFLKRYESEVQRLPFMKKGQH